jgi:hypothetical protein
MTDLIDKLVTLVTGPTTSNTLPPQASGGRASTGVKSRRGGSSMRAFLTALVLAAAALPATAASVPMGAGYGAIDAPRDIDAVTLGREFCAARLLDDMSRVSAFFAPKLQTLLADADGDVPWQSVAVRPTGCDISVINGIDDAVGVMLLVSYSAEGRTWSDTLNLQRTPETWLINNVFYEAGGNLRFRLFEAAD